jgi:polysaccharide pyruvyl transferase WcaK-like protein
MIPLKIAFFGLFGQGNLGNDCTLQAIIFAARRYFPDAELISVCSGPEEAREIFNIPTFPISRRYLGKGTPEERMGQRNHFIMLLRKILIGLPNEFADWLVAFRTLKGAHIFFVPGTGILCDAFTGPFGWPYEELKWSLVAKLSRCKLFYLSIGAGPIYSPISRWFIKLALFLADSRSYRDNSSMKYLKGIGFRTNNDRVYPDLVFGLPEAVIPPGEVRKGQKSVVGIGIMSYLGSYSHTNPDNDIHVAYLEKLAIFVKWLLTHKYDVRLLTGDTRDECIKQKFRDLLKENASDYSEGRILDEPILSVEHLLSQLVATDIVVATRFHNILLALVLNKPVISISFHHKCVSLMETMGLSEYMQDMRHLNVDRLIAQFIKLEKNSEKLKPLIKQKTEELRDALDEQYNSIFQKCIQVKEE